METEFLHAHQSTSSSSSSHAHTPLPPSPHASSPPDAFATTAAAATSGNDSPTSGDASTGGSGSVVSNAADRLISGFLTCVFAIAGFFVGAVTGALRGLGTESGLLRGAGIGAVSGAVFSIDVVESSLLTWRSGGSGLCSILYVMSAVDAPYREALDLFETGGACCGMPRASVDRIPKLRVTVDNGVDASGDRICCSVCLQDLQPGETARRLPHCGHMFHLPCIDCWLRRHGSCPLCRRSF